MKKVSLVKAVKDYVPVLTINTCMFLFPQDIADPFFAYCKQHADRFDRKWKRKNYLALQSYCKVSLQEREKQLTPEAQVRCNIKSSICIHCNSQILNVSSSVHMCPNDSHGEEDVENIPEFGHFATSSVK